MGFNSSNSSQSSSNRAFGQLNGIYTPQAQTGVGASNALAALLGVGGDPVAQEGAFQNYLNSAGYKFNLQQGQNAITSSNAANGLLNSGAALKSLAGFGQGLASNYLKDYLGQLSGLSQLGLGAGGLIANAGQQSKGKSKGLGFTF